MLTNPFPPKIEVLQACRCAEYPPHTVLDYAHELAVLHERRLSARNGDLDDIDSERERVIGEIDRWVLLELPPAHGSAWIHTETLGSVLDRLARFTAKAYAALAGSTAGDWELWDAWERLAELAVAYEDLTAEVAAGRRRLPGGQ